MGGGGCYNVFMNLVEFAGIDPVQTLKRLASVKRLLG